MPVPTTIADLSTVAADNSPQGSEPIGTSLDNYIRAGFAFVKQLSTGSGASGTWGISITGNAATATSATSATTSTTATTATTAKNVAVDSASGTFGFVPGSGGTVTQATSKSTAVTLNKPTGKITMHSASLAANASVAFQCTNSLVTKDDTVLLSIDRSSVASTTYFLTSGCDDGAFTVRIMNATGSALADAVGINFTIIKGATS